MTSWLIDAVLLLAVIVLAPLALAVLLLTVAVLATAAGDIRSRRRMRRHLDELIKERG